MPARLLFAMLFAFIVFSWQSAHAVDKNMFLLPGDLERFDELLEQRWPPSVADVIISPEVPEPDEEVEITVRVADHPESGDDDTMEVAVYFSADDGETWELFTLDDEDDDLWIGEFPGQPSGTTVMYGIRILKESGNAYMEAVCMAEESPLSGDEDFDGDCFNDADSDKCEDGLPDGCMFPLAVEETPLDDQSSLVPEPFDARDYRIGYDGEHIFLDYTFEGKLSELQNIPSMSPFFMTAIFLPDKTKYDYGLEAVLGSGGMLGYLPAHKIPCSLDMLKGNEIVESASGVECAARGNHVMFSIDRSAFEPGQDELNLIAMNAYVVAPEEGRKFIYGPILKTVTVVVDTRVRTGPEFCSIDMNGNRFCFGGTFSGSVERRDEIQEYNPVTMPGRLYDTNYFTKVKFITRSYEVP